MRQVLVAVSFLGLMMLPVFAGATDEANIPVKIEEVKRSAAPENGLFRTLSIISVLGIIGCATFFYLRRSKMMAGASKHAPQIKILTQHYLGPKKSLAIVRVAGESILIGVTDHNISLIKSLSLLDEDIPEETPKQFKQVLKTDQEQDLEDRDFSIVGIQDVVSSRLKNMRSLE